ncbi:uncharacterized protein LOC110343149 isoform X10 [Mesocricetus auratus]|uniref:Uncharacterized protein LOC110343149 isoform X10 n=1 Tax=Mesocricetus auratus TaxID=10036 RepID=A0ABM2X8R8_MESAU|nr:uncharacterized protein LOC110343149 isoform X10 [Mesocricetus auratus]
MGLAGRGRAQDAAANAVGAERGILTSVSGHTLCLPVPTVSHGRCPVAPCGAGHACPQPSDVREWRGPALLQPPSVPKGAPPELGAQGTWATSRVQEAGAWNCVAPGSLTHPDPFKMPATSSAPPHFLSPLLPKSDIGREHCRFPSLSLCHMTNISVFLPNDPGATATWILFPESDPNRPAAATDLHCWLHHVDHVSCRWGRGPGAPSDVQYRMFWRDARGPDPAHPAGQVQWQRHCPRELGDAEPIPPRVRVPAGNPQGSSLRAGNRAHLREPLPGPNPRLRLLPSPGEAIRHCRLQCLEPGRGIGLWPWGAEPGDSDDGGDACGSGGGTDGAGDPAAALPEASAPTHPKPQGPHGGESGARRAAWEAALPEECEVTQVMEA